MARLSGPYFVQPPVMSVRVEDSMDVMIVRDTVRRAGSLLGFSPANRAQLASAAATLAELVLKTGEPQDLHLNGVRQGEKVGLQISSEAPWLANVATSNVLIALRSKLGDLVDEILVEGNDPPNILLVMWLSEAVRRDGHREDEDGDDKP
ncbi:MAG: hypothetical protein K8J31_26105 [Anaerolineae bacterium]|nr:hypothetical protein [Anaerolineae bacterium]